MIHSDLVQTSDAASHPIICPTEYANAIVRTAVIGARVVSVGPGARESMRRARGISGPTAPEVTARIASSINGHSGGEGATWARITSLTKGWVGAGVDEDR